VLAEGWKPWSLIVGGIAFVGWVILIAEFVSTRWRRYRGSASKQGGRDQRPKRKQRPAAR
jgi:hypothetical protein